MLEAAGRAHSPGPRGSACTPLHPPCTSNRGKQGPPCSQERVPCSETASEGTNSLLINDIWIAPSQSPLCFSQLQAEPGSSSQPNIQHWLLPPATDIGGYLPKLVFLRGKTENKISNTKMFLARHHVLSAHPKAAQVLCGSLCKATESEYGQEQGDSVGQGLSRAGRYLQECGSKPVHVPLQRKHGTALPDGGWLTDIWKRAGHHCWKGFILTDYSGAEH